MAKITYKLFYNTTRKLAGHNGYSIAVAIDGTNCFYLDFKKPEHWKLQSYAPTSFRTELQSTLEAINESIPDEKRMVVADFKAAYKGNRECPNWTAVLDTYDSQQTLTMLPWDGHRDPVEYQLKPYSYFKNSTPSSDFNKNPPLAMRIDDWDQLNLGSPMKQIKQLEPEINWDTYCPTEAGGSQSKDGLGTQLF